MRRFLTFVLLALLLAGCANLPSLLSTPQPAAIPTNTPSPTNTPANTTPQATPNGPRILRVWVPPQFDPAADTDASRMLQARLDDFAERRPGLVLEIRVKEENGPAGLLDSLVTTNAAAPSIMPDLVALSRSNLESAALKGVLHPLDGLTGLLDDPDWYPYAIQMARIQNTTYGMPFAGDALALIGYAKPMPARWIDIQGDTTFLFPGTDPQALFSLSLYKSAGGILVDEGGMFVLDQKIMSDVLTFYTRSAVNEYLPYSVVNFQDYNQTWEAFQERRVSMVVGWTKQYLDNPSQTIDLAPLPALDDGSYTLATGWTWALAGSDLENQPLAVELAEFLSDSEFLTAWTEVAGYLPTRPTALTSWQDALLATKLGQVADSAQLVPGNDVLVTFGPLFQEAVQSVMNGEQLPTGAAQSAAEQLE